MFVADKEIQWDEGSERARATRLRRFRIDENLIKDWKVSLINFISIFSVSKRRDDWLEAAGADREIYEGRRALLFFSLFIQFLNIFESHFQAWRHAKRDRGWVVIKFLLCEIFPLSILFRFILP